MIWYLWRMSRRNILLLSALCAAVALSIRMVQHEDAVAAYAYIDLISQVFLITILGGCMFMRGPDTSFVPAPWLLTLPLAPRRYLVVFYGYVAMVVGTIAFALTALHLCLFGNVLQVEAPRVVLTIWHMPLLCVALACLVQSMFHLSGIKNEFRVVPMAIAAEVLAFVCVLSVLDPGNMNDHRIEYTALVALLFAWASSHNSLTAYRNGRQRDGIAALLEWLDLGQGRTTAFISPDRALFWLGWRRYGRMFPLWSLGLGLMSLALVGGIESYLRSVDHGEALIVYYLSTLPAIACSTILSHALILIRTREDLFGTGSGYFLALPVRSVALARGRLLATVLSVSMVVAVESALFCPFLCFGPRPMVDDVIFTMPLAILAVWLALWFGLPIAGGYIASVLVLAGVSMLLDTGGTHMEVWFFTGLAIMSIAISGFLLSRGIKRRLLGRLDWGLFAAVCIPILAVTAFLVWPEPADDRSLAHNLVISLLALGGLLPVALPFIAAPVLTDWIRHR
jgi:hypothetical protein